MNFKKVLFLGAHPDDEIACAGTLHKLVRDGSEVEALTFSDLGGSYPLAGEWIRSMTAIGVSDRVLLDLPVRLLSDYAQTILDLLIKRRDLGYDLVFVPASSDIHQDHAVVRDEAVRAFKHTTMLGYEHIQNTVTTPFNPTTFVRLYAADIEAKLGSAAAYVSQHDRIYMHEEVVDASMTFRGAQAGVAAAEAFETIRMML